MQTFENCVCIAQARVIAGFKRESHICTIAYQPAEARFLRLCVPYVQGRSPVIKRWSVFDFDGSKDSLPNNDTREESWDAVAIRRKLGTSLKKRDLDHLHRKILSEYKYQDELNESRESIGILIPVPSSLRFSQNPLSPHNPDDAKKLERVEHMKAKGIWFPSFEVRVRGEYHQDGALKRFDRQLLAWDVYEALRKGTVDPFSALYGYKNPYMITGNTARNRGGFMVIGVLSAPNGAIEKHAIHQQLALV
jgi:hypothetical protein